MKVTSQTRSPTAQVHVPLPAMVDFVVDGVKQSAVNDIRVLTERSPFR